MAYKLPELGYEFAALEPHIDAKTMEIHHDKHHQAYIDKLNAALEDEEELLAMDVEELLSNFDKVPEAKKTAVKNHGGGHANHTLFWEILTPGGASEPSGDLSKAIDDVFGSFADFKQKLTEAATGQFGSGWGWLVVSEGKLEIMALPNQDSPLMTGKTPILGVDVWEHAYYLKYQNKRPDYLEAWWNVVNWDKVAEKFSAAA
jgi:superoxide dismutase, Fe-Mn family